MAELFPIQEVQRFWNRKTRPRVNLERTLQNSVPKPQKQEKQKEKHMAFTVHTTETAPEASKPILEGAAAKYGFTPNLLGVLAESPSALKAYGALAEAVAGTSLSPTEQQVVLMTTSFENNCTYCMAAHSTISGMTGVPEDVVESLRAGTPLADAKLNALADFTRATVRNNGFVDSSVTDAFLAAGYTNESILDVITAIAQKTISNFTNHFAHTPSDDAFAPKAWTKPANA